MKGLGRREGATVYMVLLAAFEVVLWRYTGQEDFAVGSPFSSRAHTGVEGLIGLFLEPVVLAGVRPNGALDSRRPGARSGRGRCRRHRSGGGPAYQPVRRAGPSATSPRRGPLGRHRGRRTASA